MSDENTDRLRNWLIVLPFIFIMFLIVALLAFFHIEGLLTAQIIDWRNLYSRTNCQIAQRPKTIGDRTTTLPDNLKAPAHWK